MHISLSLRLTLLFATASTTVILVLGYLIGAAVEEHFVEQDMEILGRKLDLTRKALGKVGSVQDLDAIPQVIDDALVGHGGLAIVVIAPDETVLFATSDVDFPHALFARPMRADATRPLVWKSARGIPFRGVTVEMVTGLPGAKPARVAVATDISHHEHFMMAFRRTLWSFVFFASLLTGFLGWLAVRSGLSPLRVMRQRAEGITAQGLDARLTVESVPVELAELALSLNRMLARLEDSFRRLSDFSSDLAHEFRTPVSNLLTQSQVMLSRPRSIEEYRDVLVSNVEEYERLSRMIADMLFIAKADDGRIVPAREPLDLARLVSGLVEAHRPVAEEKQVAVECSGIGWMNGDSLMIRRAVSNLLSNAIRHAPAGGRVEVAVRSSQASGVSIEVSNTGEMIPTEHLPRLFDRFFRADPSRSGEGGQSGLGLAIVKSIVEAHGGEVSVLSRSGSTTFCLRLGPR